MQRYQRRLRRPRLQIAVVWLLLATEPLPSAQPCSSWKEGGEGKRLRRRRLAAARAPRSLRALTAAVRRGGPKGSSDGGVAASEASNYWRPLCMQHGSSGSKTGCIRSAAEAGAARSAGRPPAPSPGREPGLLAPPTRGRAEPRAAARADSPRVHPAALCSGARQAPHASGAVQGDPRRPGHPRWDARPPSALRLCLASPVPEGRRAGLEARARDPNPTFARGRLSSGGFLPWAELLTPRGVRRATRQGCGPAGRPRPSRPQGSGILRRETRSAAGSPAPRSPKNGEANAALRCAPGPASPRSGRRRRPRGDVPALGPGRAERPTGSGRGGRRPRGGGLGDTRHL